MTDDNGNFTFRRLAPGTYTIAIDADKEYEPVNEQINIIQPMRSINAPEQIIPVHIKLQIRRSSEYKSGVVNAEFANVPKRALELYSKALELSQAGKSKAAVEKLKQAISEYSGFMLAFNELGVQYMRLGELEKANESLQSALKIAPEAFTPLLNHGIALALLRQFDQAETELRRALNKKEQSAVAHYYLGQALANLRRFDEAEEHLTRAVVLGGDEMKDAHRFLGAIYSQRGNNEHAIAEFETYLRLAPTAKDAEQIRQVIRQLKGSNPRVPNTPPKANPRQ